MPKPLRTIEKRFKPIERKPIKKPIIKEEHMNSVNKFRRLVIVNNLKKYLNCKTEDENLIKVSDYLTEQIDTGKATTLEVTNLLRQFEKLKLKDNYSLSNYTLAELLANSTNLPFNKFRKAINIIVKYTPKRSDRANTFYFWKSLSKIFLKTNALENDFLLNRLETILSGPLSEYRLEEFYNNIKNQEDSDRPQIIESTKCTYNVATVSKKSVYRNVSKNAFDIWKELFEDHLPVETIEEIYSEQQARENKKFVKFGENQIYVKSKIDGITITELISGRYELTNEQIISIAKQIINIITNLWSRGISHYHPHNKNWTITFENGHPKVKLIDFKRAIRQNQYFYSNSIMQDYSNSRKAILNLFSKFNSLKRQDYFHILEKLLKKQYEKYSPI